MIAASVSGLPQSGRRDLIGQRLDWIQFFLANGPKVLRFGIGRGPFPEGT
jgi:hypothetical protein